MTQPRSRYCIPVYRSERTAGLAEAIQANASLSYLVAVEPCQDAAFCEGLRTALASRRGDIGDERDLYYLKDILVTTGRNKNRDIFDRAEAWAARHTPEDKPFNFEHRPLDIIGHITASRVVDEAMVEVDDDTAIDDLPPRFHIVNGSVLYMALADEERQKVMEQTVEEIERGEWYVSMECLFRGFDYGVEAPDGTQRVIARNESTAFLTKHLSQYGGNGVFLDEQTGDEYILSRVLRNITFSGKGLVRQPANPDSVILNSVAAFNPIPADSGYLTAGPKATSSELPENISMADSNAGELALRDENRRLEKQVEELQRDNAGLKSKDTEVALANLRKDVSDRDAMIADIQRSSTASANQIAGLTTQVDEITRASKAIEARAEKAEADLATAREDIARAKAGETRRARLLIVTDKGLESAAAEALVESWAHLSDDQFTQTLGPVLASLKKPEPKGKGDPVVAAIKKAKVEEEPALATASDEVEEREQARATIRDFLGQSLSKARGGRPSVFATTNEE